jgi:hypothetical protein
MKTKLILLFSLMIFQTGFLKANAEGSPVGTCPENSICAILAPVIPQEATFEETTIAFEVASLMPVAPSEAAFEESTEETPTGMTPVVPREAGFSVEDVTN